MSVAARNGVFASLGRQRGEGVQNLQGQRRSSGGCVWVGGVCKTCRRSADHPEGVSGWVGVQNLRAQRRSSAEPAGFHPAAWGQLNSTCTWTRSFGETSRFTTSL